LLSFVLKSIINVIPTPKKKKGKYPGPGVINGNIKIDVIK